MQPFFYFITGQIFYPFYSRGSRRIPLQCQPFLKKGSRVLDLGCGHGLVGLAFQNYFQAEVLGVDIADQRIVDIPFKCIDGKNLPFPDNSFETVLIVYVLHHTGNYLNLLKEAKRVSKNKIIIYENLPEGFWSKLFCHLHGFLFSVMAMFKKEKHYFKTENEWLEIFNSLNLSVVHKKEVESGFLMKPVRHIQFVLKKKDI